MNIVLVMDQFGHSNNGTTVTARRLAKNLHANGHKVTVLAAGASEIGKINAKKHSIPIFQKLIESQGMFFAKPDPLLYYEAFKDADVAHFFMPFRFCREGVKYAQQMNVPILGAFHVQPENITSTLFLEKFDWVNQYLYRWFYKRFYCYFDYIHCPSQFIAGQLVAEGYDAETRVISNGVDHAFKPIAVERGNSSTIQVVMVGRLSREKRQDLVIKAAQRSKYADKIQLVFAGKGPCRRKYVKLAKRSKLPHPPIFQFYSQEELLRVLNSSDLYIHASDVEIEGISCLEAMACGLVPIISDSQLAATRQFALDSNSLFAAGDPEDLARKLDYWIEHSDEKKALSQQYIAQQNNNRVDACVKQMEDLYRDVISKCRREGFKTVPIEKKRRFLAPDPRKVNSNLLSHKRWPKHTTQIISFLVGCILYPVNKLWLGLRVEGMHNMKLIKGTGAVTVSNHVHHLDCSMVKLATLGRRTWFTSLYENFQIPVVGYLVKGLGAAALGQSTREKCQVHRALLHNIKNGDLVHYYPEGMLIPYYNGLRPMYGGAFAIAVQAKCPVVPMVVTSRENRGLYRLKKRPCMTLHILPPIYPLSGLSGRQGRQALQLRVEQSMQEVFNDRGLWHEAREPSLSKSII